MRDELRETADAALVKEYLSGDPDAFKTLYRRYFRRLAEASGRVLHDQASAEDVAQDALIRAHDHLHVFDLRKPLWPWLRAIAVRLAINEAHRHKRVVPAASPEVAAVVESDHAEDVANHRAVTSALERLPVRQRKALVARYVEGWPRRDAAARMGVREGAFDQLLLRGRRRLAAELRAL